MKKKGIAVALLTIILLSCGTVQAQKPASKSIVPAAPAPDLTAMNVGKILQQVSTANVPSSVQANAQPSGGETTPLQVVAQYLQLQPPQLNELEQLLQARQAALVPLFATAQNLTQQLGILLNTGGNPLQVGAVFIHIYALQQQMGQVEQAFVAQFAATLDPDQLQRLQAVQIAIQLQPVLPAFQPIYLF